MRNQNETNEITEWQKFVVVRKNVRKMFFQLEIMLIKSMVPLAWILLLIRWSEPKN